MIFDTPPSNWKELQRLVCQAFQEMSCYSELEKTIDLVRGKKEIDVYVEDFVHDIRLKILIECKQWNSDIHQDVIHGFRTVVNDSGANKGIIIVKKGFQSGAYEASDKAPIELLSWEEFNIKYFKKWRESCERRLREKALELHEFRNFPYGPSCDEPLVELSREEHDDWWEYMNGFSMILILGNRKLLSELDEGPVKIIHPNSDLEKAEDLNWWEITSYREWYDYANSELDRWLKKTREWNRKFESRRESA
ncbi:restriction endonuclease [Billgrantia montanilacus]|uniref:Restriction endonuclease n=1 Tax=Billgrantia montanilacus TaxID=2282305 RepID=A0A368TQL7_9GAMM|nr:restriction endonuclease [Halomonas montanilacus]RCV86944.1 restriction endonuclease [Halomonas montanilacus]